MFILQQLIDRHPEDGYIQKVNIEKCIDVAVGEHTYCCPQSGTCNDMGLCRRRIHKL